MLVIRQGMSFSSIESNPLYHSKHSNRRRRSTLESPTTEEEEELLGGDVYTPPPSDSEQLPTATFKMGGNEVSLHA